MRYAEDDLSAHLSKNQNQNVMFNVQSKTDRASDYCTNQTKRLMEKKLKRKPLSSPVSVNKAVRWKGWVYGGKDSRKRKLECLKHRKLSTSKWPQKSTFAVLVLYQKL